MKNNKKMLKIFGSWHFLQIQRDTEIELKLVNLKKINSGIYLYTPATQ